MASAPSETQTVRAQAKWVRMSARKGRIVAEHIRGRSVPEARAVLAFTQRAAAREIEKVLSSAVANAEANNGLVGDDLFVYTVVVDEGPTLKRWKARARGRVARIKKRTCHVTVTLTPIEAPVAARPKKAEPKKTAPNPKAEPTPVSETEVSETQESAAAEEPKAETTPEPKTEKKPRTPRRKKTEEADS